MSYDIAAGAGARLEGTFTSTYSMPVTLACWINLPSHDATSDYIFTLSKDTEGNELVAIYQISTADAFWALSVNASGTTQASQYTGTTDQFDGIWTPMVARFTSTTSRRLWMNDDAGALDADSSDPSSVLNRIVVGVSPPVASRFKGKVAECAIWNGELSTADITAYSNGTPASSIDTANLIGYWPLNYDNTTQTNESTGDASGDLTVTTATYSSDHPIITGKVILTDVISITDGSPIQ